MIKKLQTLNDELIGKFKNDELLPITSESGYHSPEDSEEGEDGNQIVVRKLRWRSSTVSKIYWIDLHKIGMY